MSGWGIQGVMLGRGLCTGNRNWGAASIQGVVVAAV